MMRHLLILTILILSSAVARAEWITPKGKAYHKRRECIALRTTKQPKEVSKADAERLGLHPCGICLRTKGAK
jgi:hypothetical protein